MVYKTKGVCASAVSFDLVDGKISGAKFTGGCSGNTQGVCALVEGMDAKEAIKRLSGIRCGFHILPGSAGESPAGSIKPGRLIPLLVMEKASTVSVCRCLFWNTLL